tara:strand:+ start:975 stop:1220 length:246 start_codon:yes stop_codon:yes gene_type:complete
MRESWLPLSGFQLFSRRSRRSRIWRIPRRSRIWRIPRIPRITRITRITRLWLKSRLDFLKKSRTVFFLTVNYFVQMNRFDI